MAMSILNMALSLVLAPLLLGVINRTKAVFAGRTGQPLVQPYRDILKLLGKGAVYSRTTTWVFKAGPAVSCAGVLTALAVTPSGGSAALVCFPGDIMLFAGALGLGRFFTVAAALDTGSAFEGMGASREVWFSALTEPALLLGLAAMARLTGAFSLTDIYASLRPDILLARGGPALLLVAAAFCLALLAENSRIPFDDPNTHLELTMVHEVMVLDHGGPDLGLIECGAALKLWVFCSLVAGIIVPLHSGHPILDLVTGLLTMLCLAAAIGVVESIMARLRLGRVSQLLTGAVALSVVALMLVQGTP